MKSILTPALAGLCLLALTACNTIQGAGRDITRAGEALEDAVDN
ncbi:MAG: entericidin A/B family lipoprotein [Oceanicaulis sp.]